MQLCSVLIQTFVVEKRPSCFHRVTLDVQKTFQLWSYNLICNLQSLRHDQFIKSRDFTICRKLFHLQIFHTIYSILRVSHGFCCILGDSSNQRTQISLSLHYLHHHNLVVNTCSEHVLNATPLWNTCLSQ